MRRVKKVFLFEQEPGLQLFLRALLRSVEFDLEVVSATGLREAKARLRGAGDASLVVVGSLAAVRKRALLRFLDESFPGAVLLVRFPTERGEPEASASPRRKSIPEGAPVEKWRKSLAELLRCIP